MVEHSDTVELLGYYGNDEVIACSAWTSTSRNLSEDKKQRIPQLIKSLWKNGHETPFEKGVLHFLVNTNVAVHIQIIKHRIGVSVNAESARYKELKEDKYYLPPDWENIENSKFSETMSQIVGDYSISPVDGCRKWLDILEWYTMSGNKLYHQCVEDLTPILGRKRAKESARFFKTYNSQIQADVMFNMRSFANFQKLRNSDKAQLEIKDIAQQMISLVENIPGNPFESTLQAWKECGVYK